MVWFSLGFGFFCCLVGVLKDGRFVGFWEYEGNLGGGIVFAAKGFGITIPYDISLTVVFSYVVAACLCCWVQFVIRMVWLCR
jgi:hypothetical protein